MKPYIVLVAAMSLDGRISGKEGGLIFSRLDNYRLHALRGKADAIMVGVDSVRADNPDLQVRELGYKYPTQIVIDPNADIPLDSTILQNDASTILVSTQAVKKPFIKKLEEKFPSVTVWQVGSKNVNFELMLNRLAREGLKRILLEGGGRFNRRLLEEGHVNELYLTVAPLFLGKGGEFFTSKMGRQIDLELDGIQQFGDQVVLHYLVK